MTDEGGEDPCLAELVCDRCGTLAESGSHQCLAPPLPVPRTIVGFHQDEAGDWVAELSCLHGQHVRHRPPLWPREWATTEAGRSARVGTELGCPLCARAEMPDALEVVRTAGPFDEASVPPALLADHVVAAGRWGLLRVVGGSLRFSLQTEPPVVVALESGDRQAIPPELPHHVVVDGAVTFEIDFLTRT